MSDEFNILNQSFLMSIILFYYIIFRDAVRAMTSQSINIINLKRHIFLIPFINMYTLAIHKEILIIFIIYYIQQKTRTTKIIREILGVNLLNNKCSCS